MDLAEIRKKARTSNAKTPSVPEAKKSASEDAPIVSQAPEPSPPPEPLVDPLTVLFQAPSDMALATEVGSLKGLGADEEYVFESRKWLAFLLGNEEYALDIGDIIEIIKPREITDIPRVPEFILGVVSLRGVLITILDLKNRLHLGLTELTPESRIIVCQHDDRVAGLLVDSLTHVVNIPVEHIEPPPAMLSGFDRELVAGVGRHHGRMMILLQLSSVLDAELI